MKVNKRMAVRGGAALVSLLGLVSASAFLITSTNTTDTVSGDSAIVLKWGQTNSIGDISSLTPSAPAYRSVTGSWTKSSSVTGFAKFTFKLTTENKIKVGQRKSHRFNARQRRYVQQNEKSQRQKRRICQNRRA